MIEHQSTAGRTAVRLWGRWLLTLVAIVALGSWLLPLARSKPQAVHDFFKPLGSWQRTIFILTICVSITAVVFEITSPRLKHMRHLLRHPPAWLACLLGVGGVAALDLLIGLSPEGYHASDAEWAGFVGGAVAFVATARRVYSVSRNVDGDKLAEPVFRGAAANDWASIETWLRTDAPAESDLLGTYNVAARLVEIIVNPGVPRSVGVVGAFGAGKSTVIRWVRAILEETSGRCEPRVLFSPHSCWGFESSSLAIHQILADAVERVGAHIDTFQVRSLPESYLQAFSATAGWADAISRLLPQRTSPAEQFHSLSDLLGCMGATLVFIVEDLDRNESKAFDVQEILAFLQQVRGCPNITFILTGGLGTTPRIDYAKLCDHVEYLAPLAPSQVSRLTAEFRKACLSQSAFRREVFDRDDDVWNQERYQLPALWDVVSPSGALTSLLSTPRALKCALARTHLSWKVLAGEVDFDHLLAINVLRCGATEALSFLLRNWERLRSGSVTGIGSTEKTRIRARINSDWAETVQKADWDGPAAQALINFMLPRSDEWFNDSQPDFTRRRQGVVGSRYWRRAISESIDKSEMRDQRVACDLRTWCETLSPDSPLISSLCSSTPYCEIWGEWAFDYLQSDERKVLNLATQVLTRTCKIHKSAATLRDGKGADYLTRYVQDRVQPSELTRDWLCERIAEAAPRSLALVADLWCILGTGSRSILPPDQRNHVRRHLIDAVRMALPDGTALSRLLNLAHEYTLRKLVYGLPTTDPAEPADNDAWRWLSPLIMESLANKDANVVLEVCRLIQKLRAGYADEWRAAAWPAWGWLFGDDTETALNLISIGSATITGDDGTFVEQIVATARTAFANQRALIAAAPNRAPSSGESAAQLPPSDS